ncbi:MAG: NYN domain-containing protein [Nitrospirae bacterium]|nr:NYN domain-containing protein [Nitrospirota bacterium]
MQNEREHLITRLSEYEKIRHIPICVVFDGWKDGRPTQTFEMKKGIEVIFSRMGEKADQVIIRLLGKLKEQCIVVSSDREIRNYAHKVGATSLTVREFQLKLDQSGQTLLPEIKEEEMEELPRNKKKGNPNKLSKKERAKNIKLKKL